jgi:hypothetical protein
MAAVTPVTHAAHYNSDNRFNHRPTLYPRFEESWAFGRIDEVVDRLEREAQIEPRTVEEISVEDVRLKARLQMCRVSKNKLNSFMVWESDWASKEIVSTGSRTRTQVRCTKHSTSIGLDTRIDGNEQYTPINDAIGSRLSFVARVWG